MQTESSTTSSPHVAGLSGGGQGLAAGRGRGGERVGAKKRGPVAAAGAGVVVPDGVGDFKWVETAFFREEMEEVFGEVTEGDAVCGTRAGIEPVAEMEEGPERGGMLPDEGGGIAEVAAVGDEVPIACEASKPLHGIEIDQLRAEDFVGGRGAVDHPPCLIVANDRSSAKSFEDSDLDFLRFESDKAIEA